MVSVETKKKGWDMTPLLAFAIFILVVGGVIVFAGVKAVPQGRQYTVERFGRYTRTLRPGMNVIIPFLDRVGAKINMMETVIDVPKQEVITRDNATVSVDGVVFFQVIEAARAAYEVNNLSSAILNLVTTNLRTVMGSMDLDALLSQRDDINGRLMRVIDEATSPWGVKITRIEIKDISPPTEMVDAMARQMKAEREKRASILEAEGKKQSEILRAQGARDAVVMEAEARKESSFRDAEAKERLAEAEAKATTLLSDAIAGGNPNAVNYQIAQEYVKALASMASGTNNKMIFMPYEISGMLSTIGGIGELAKSTFGANTNSWQKPLPNDGTDNGPESGNGEDIKRDA